MALERNKDEFQLKEGILEKGTITAPENIGEVGNGDPNDSFTGGEDIGFFKQGTLNFGLTRTFAEALAGTPAIKVRKDLITKFMMISVEGFQLNAELMALDRGLLVSAGFDDSGFTGDLGFLGSDEPTQPFDAYRITTSQTDGTPLFIIFFEAKVTTEDVGLAFSGTEHVTTNIQIEAFPHPNFATTGVPAQKHYGVIVRDLTP